MYILSFVIYIIIIGIISTGIYLAFIFRIFFIVYIYIFAIFTMMNTFIIMKDFFLFLSSDFYHCQHEIILNINCKLIYVHYLHFI